MTASKLTPIDKGNGVKKVDLSDLDLVQLASGHDRGIAYATGHTRDRTGVVIRLADGTFSLNPKGTKVLVTDDEGDVIDKWPLTVRASGHDFTLTPKITEGGRKLKLTVTEMDGKPAPKPRPAGAAAGPGVVLRSPDRDEDIRKVIHAGGFAVGAIFGTILGGLAAIPTLGTAGVVTIGGGFTLGGIAGATVGAIIAEAVLPS